MVATYYNKKQRNIAKKSTQKQLQFFLKTKKQKKQAC